MTNQQIIIKELLEQGIEKKAELEERLSLSGDTGYCTYQEWQRLGYQVKKGEKSFFRCYIWMPKNKKYINENNDEEIKITGDFYKKLAIFFKYSQVERIN